MYRFFEILPGAAAWITLLGLVFLSWRAPVAVAVFIVLYDLYWFLKTIYLLILLNFSFARMRANLKVDWFPKLQATHWPWQRLYHLVVLPMYRESADLVRESLNCVLKSNYPKDKIFVVLATEERGGEADLAVAMAMENEFGDKFGKFLYTVHPGDTAGELPGKGSNETFAMKEAVKKMIDAAGIDYDDVMVSIFDIDTRPGPDYFAVLTYKFFESPNGRRSSFQPVPVFINNIHHVPAFARLIAFTATFWQFMQQARPEQLVTFSSHAMPLRPLIEIGFWHTDIVSEDSRIFFQCFLHYDGNWQVIPLYYPIYMDAVEGGSFWEALKNLYKQQRRWAWGSENIAYVFTSLIKNTRIAWRQKFLWFYVLFEGFYSWATSSFIIFVFGYLPIVLGGLEFNQSVLSYNLPKVTGVLMNLSVLGIVTSAWVSVVIVAPKLRGMSFLYYILYFFQWFLMPITFLIFASIPALDAQTRLMLSGRFRLGFWKTPKGEIKLNRG